jgi:hypothetical protein
MVKTIQTKVTARLTSLGEIVKIIYQFRKTVSLILQLAISKDLNRVNLEQVK